MLLTHPRGAIFWAQAPKHAQDSVQDGARPVLIVSNDMNNLHSSVVTVVSLTSQEKNNIPTHVIIPAVNGNGLNTILCEQIRTVPKEALDKYCGTLTEEVMDSVDKALMVQLGIKTETQTQPQAQTKPKVNNQTGPKGYSDEYKKQYLKHASEMSNAALAKKYGITAKAAWTRTKSWTEQFK